MTLPTVATQGAQRPDVVAVAGPAHNDVRKLVTAGLVAVAMLAGVVVGRTTAPREAAPDVVHERDGLLPVGVPVRLEGWQVSREGQPTTAECVLVQPRQRAPEAPGGLDGAVVDAVFPRRIKPDPAGRLTARVTCLDRTTGTQLGSVRVRPRSYVATPPEGAAPDVVSEVAVDQARLDALGRLVASARPLVADSVVYLVRSPLRYDARAALDTAGDITMPAELTEDPELAEVVLFHGLMVTAFRTWTAGSETTSTPPPPALLLRAYEPGAAVDATRAGAAASALTVWRYHRADLMARLRRLPAHEQLAVRQFVRRVVRPLSLERERAAALEALAPGVSEF